MGRLGRSTGLLVMLALAAESLGGCATIVHGGKQDVTLGSVPPGASVKVTGREPVTTPAQIELKRNQDHRLVFEKDGFPAREIVLASMMSWWIMGNLILGGILGIVIDLSTGSGYKLEPGSVEMDMSTGKTREIPAEKK